MIDKNEPSQTKVSIRIDSIILNQPMRTEVSYTQIIHRENGESQSRGICFLGEAIEITQAELDGDE